MVDKVHNWEVRRNLAFNTTSIINSIIKKDKRRFIEVMLQFYNSKAYRSLYEELLNSNRPSQVDSKPFEKLFIDELEISSSDSISYQINYELLDEMLKQMKINKKAGYYFPDFKALPLRIERYGSYKGLSALEVISLVKNKEYQNKYIEAEVRNRLALRIEDMVNSIIKDDKKRFIEVMLRFYDSDTYQSLYQELYNVASSSNPWIARNLFREIDYGSFEKMFMDEVESTPEYIDPIPYPINYELLDEEEGEVVIDEELELYKTMFKADFVGSLPLFISGYAFTKGISDQEAIALFKKYDILNYLIDLSAFFNMDGRVIEGIDCKIEHQNSNFHLENTNDFEPFYFDLEEIFLILSSILI